MNKGKRERERYTHTPGEKMSAVVGRPVSLWQGGESRWSAGSDEVSSWTQPPAGRGGWALDSVEPATESLSARTT